MAVFLLALFKAPGAFEFIQVQNAAISKDMLGCCTFYATFLSHFFWMADACSIAFSRLPLYKLLEAFSQRTHMDSTCVLGG